MQIRQRRFVSALLYSSKSSWNVTSWHFIYSALYDRPAGNRKKNGRRSKLNRVNGAEPMYNHLFFVMKQRRAKSFSFLSLRNKSGDSLACPLIVANRLATLGAKRRVGP